MDPVVLQEQYVDTFDTRRGCLHLTYQPRRHRRRGMALLRIKQDRRRGRGGRRAERLITRRRLEPPPGTIRSGARRSCGNRPGVELRAAPGGTPPGTARWWPCARPCRRWTPTTAPCSARRGGTEEETVAGRLRPDADAAALGGQTFAASGCTPPPPRPRSRGPLRRPHERHSTPLLWWCCPHGPGGVRASTWRLAPTASVDHPPADLQSKLPRPARRCSTRSSISRPCGADPKVLDRFRLHRPPDG